jgi:hypothetical protein
MNDSQRDSLSHHAVELLPVLNVADPFDVRDVRDYLPDSKTAQMWLQLLHKRDVIRQNGKLQTKRGTVNEWVWNPDAREWLRERGEQINTLPCGCRSHIPSDIGADSETGTCNHCGTEFDKQTFKNAL